MTDRHPRVHTLLSVFLLLAGAALVGCGAIGLPGGGDPAPPTYPPETSVTGEVLRVDTGDREIEIDDAGRRHVVVYEASTPVYFEGRTYQPENLERGDVIRVRVVDDRYGTLRTDRIDVVESVQSRGGTGGPYDDDPQDRPGDWAADLAGEVDRIDPDRKEIVVRTTGGGDRLVAYDDRTRVFYQGQEYAPENLERGDLVEIRTTRTSDTRYALAERIDVTEAVQDRRDGADRGDDRTGRIERLSGTVDWIDRRRGEFGLRTGRDTVTVAIPFDASSATRDRFGRLDRGDSVRVEAAEIERSRLELIRFL